MSAITTNGRCWLLAAGSVAIAGAGGYVFQGQTGARKKWKVLIFNQVKYRYEFWSLLFVPLQNPEPSQTTN